MLKRILHTWKRRTVKPHAGSKHSALAVSSRRQFLVNSAKVLGAAMLATQTACIVPLNKLSKSKKMEFDRMYSIAHSPIVITAIREGKSVKAAFENWPDSKTYEMTFYKLRAGEIIPGATIRSSGWVVPDYPRNVRSAAHSHLPAGHSKVDMLFTSNPSLLDVLGAFGVVAPRTPPRRFSHIAAMTMDGKVMGYFSLGVGKKMNRTIQDDASRQHTTLNAVVARMKELNDYKLPEPPQRKGKNERNFRAYLQLVHSLQSLGLQIRTTPMPGYQYKDGYFQPKT